MANTYTVKGNYGTGNPCLVVCYQLPNSYTTAYAVEGSKNICFTHEEINEGVNVETITDYDYITANFPVEDEWSLREEVDEVMS